MPRSPIIVLVDQLPDGVKIVVELLLNSIYLIIGLVKILIEPPLRLRDLVLAASDLLPDDEHFEFSYGIIKEWEEAIYGALCALIIILLLHLDESPEALRFERFLLVHLYKRIYEPSDLFKVAKQEAELFELLEGDVLEVDGTDILPDAVGEEFVHHAVNVRHPSNVRAELLQEVSVLVQIIDGIQSLVDLVNVNQGGQQPLF